jgi:MFS family permease
MPLKFLIVACLVVAVNTGMGLIVPILPLFLKDYGFSTAGLSLPFLSLIIGRLISKNFAAHIIRLLTNRGTLIGCFLLYALIFFAYPLASSPALFVLLRFFEGIVEGISIICLTDLAIVLSNTNRGRLMGIFGASFGAGFVLGPTLGALVYSLYGTDAVFYAGGIIGLLAMIGACWMPLLPAASSKPPRVLRALSKYRQLLPSYGPSIIRRATFFSFMMILPLYAHEVLGLDPARVAMFFTGSALLSFVLMPFTGKLADHIAPQRILAVTLLGMGALIAAFGLARDALSFSLLFALESLLFTFMLPAGMKLFADEVEEHPQRTHVVAVFGSLTEVVTLFLALAIPTLYAFSCGLTWSFIGLLCVIAGVPFVLGRASQPQSSLAAESE